MSQQRMALMLIGFWERGVRNLLTQPDAYGKCFRVQTSVEKPEVQKS